MRDDTATIVPLEVKTVDFYGDRIIGALVRVAGAERIYVPVKPICDYLGVDWSSQRRRILRDEILGASMVMMTMETGPGKRDVAAMPLDLLPGFLFGIEGRRVKLELQEKIARYRRECFRVLWDAFRPQIVRAEDLASPPGSSGAQMAYEIATAVQHLARQQMEIEERLNAAGRWAKGIEGRVDGVEGRVDFLELSIGPRSPIDDEQASALAAAVRAVGYGLEKRGTGDYRGVYTQLYARFGITSYKNLRREKYELALAWLQEWYGEITGEPSSNQG